MGGEVHSEPQAHPGTRFAPVIGCLPALSRAKRVSYAPVAAPVHCALSARPTLSAAYRPHLAHQTTGPVITRAWPIELRASTGSACAATRRGPNARAEAELAHAACGAGERERERERDGGGESPDLRSASPRPAASLSSERSAPSGSSKSSGAARPRRTSQDVSAEPWAVLRRLPSSSPALSSLIRLATSTPPGPAPPLEEEAAPG